MNARRREDWAEDLLAAALVFAVLVVIALESL